MKQTQAEYLKEWRKRNKDRVRQYRRNWNMAHPYGSKPRDSHGLGCRLTVRRIMMGAT